jgi:hypothetical protein
VKNQCLCGCGLRRNPKRRFAPGHNSQHREMLERQPYKGNRKPPPVRLFEGRTPSKITRSTRKIRGKEN